MAGTGGKREGAGRPKGVANKATQNAREAIAGFVDGNADRLVGWLDQVAEEDPKEAFKCFMSVVEYHIPKLARVDNTNTHQNPDGTGIFQGAEIVGFEAKAGTASKDT